MPMNWTLKMVKMAKFVIYVLSQLKNSILKKKRHCSERGGKKTDFLPHFPLPTPHPQVFSIFRWYNIRIIHLGQLRICFCPLLYNCLRCQSYSNNQVYSSIPHIVISIIFSFHSLNDIMKFQPLWPQYTMVSNDPLLTAL